MTTTVPPSTSSSSPGVSPQEQVSSGSDHTGAIAGGVVGGVVGLIVLLALAWFIFWAFRKKKRAQQANYVHDVSQEPGPSFSTATHVPPSPTSPDGGAVLDSSPTILRSTRNASASAPVSATGTSPTTDPIMTGAGAGLAAGGLATVAPGHTTSPATPPQTMGVSQQPNIHQRGDDAAGPPPAGQSPSALPYARTTRASRTSPMVQNRGGSAQAGPLYSEYVDVDPALWRETWASSDSPYGRAGVGHAMEEEAPPPRAFHMQPGQLVSNASPVGAFSQPWNTAQPSHVAPTRSSRVIRESLGRGET